MERGEPIPEQQWEKNGERYIKTEARVLKKVVDMLGISEEEFVDRYAEKMSDIIRGDREIGERVINDDPTVDEDIIEALLNDDAEQNTNETT